VEAEPSRSIPALPQLPHHNRISIRAFGFGTGTGTGIDMSCGVSLSPPFNSQWHECVFWLQHSIALYPLPHPSLESAPTHTGLAALFAALPRFPSRMPSFAPVEGPPVSRFENRMFAQRPTATLFPRSFSTSTAQDSPDLRPSHPSILGLRTDHQHQDGWHIITEPPSNMTSAETFRAREVYRFVPSECV
jgi:hypothetical protein